MKFSFVKNDKTTYWDEVILSIITLVALTVGILLIVFKPSFWIIDESITICFGVLSILLAVMYTPCIIYRLVEDHNYRKDNK